MGAAIGGIASGILGATGQSGQKGANGEANASQTTKLSEGMQQPEVKTAEINKVAETTEKPKEEKSGSSIDWSELAKMATGLLNSGSGSSAPISVSNASNGGAIANFR